MTLQLLQKQHISHSDTILEPCAGLGAIADILEDNGYDVIAEDLNDKYQNDFLKIDESERFDVVITNHNFSISLDIIEKAKRVANKVIMLLPLNYLHGQKRYNTLYTDNKFTLSHVNIFTRYPMLSDDDLCPSGTYKTGMISYAWFVFTREYTKPTVIDWIDNSMFIA